MFLFPLEVVGPAEFLRKLGDAGRVLARHVAHHIRVRGLYEAPKPLCSEDKFHELLAAARYTILPGGGLRVQL